MRLCVFGCVEVCLSSRMCGALVVGSPCRFDFLKAYSIIQFTTALFAVEVVDRCYAEECSQLLGHNEPPAQCENLILKIEFRRPVKI